MAAEDSLNANLSPVQWATSVAAHEPRGNEGQKGRDHKARRSQNAPAQNRTAEGDLAAAMHDKPAHEIDSFA